MEKLKNFIDKINKAVSVVTIAFFVLLIIACVGQVVFRYVFHHPLSWSEELARYCFIWMHLVAASLLCQANEHATVTAVLDIIKGKARKILNIIIELVIFVDGSLMLIYGAQLAYNTRMNLSAALSLNMAVVNSAVAFAGLLLIIQSVAKIIINVSEMGQKAKEV